MKILLTGSTGFLGAYVLRLLLQRGYDVRALRREDSRMDTVSDVADQVEWVFGDITDIAALEDAFEGITHVVHCAAIVSFHRRDVQRMMRINVEGTANMVNLSLDFGVQRFIHVSSIAALGRSKERTELDEGSKWETSSMNTNYAISKYLSEQEVWRGQAEGLQTAIVNPAMITGSGFWEEGTARFFTQIFNGLKFCPKGRSGFVDVRDVARFMVLLLESEIENERYVLSGENMLYKDFFTSIAQALGVRPPSIPVGTFLAEVAWRVEWLKEKLTGMQPMVTRESARSSLNAFTYKNEKSLRAFGEKFAYTPIHEVIEAMGVQFKAAKTSGKRASVLDF